AIIMMLSSLERPGDRDQCEALGITAWVRKPIQQSELLNALLAALHHALPAGDAVPSSLPSHPAPLRPLHILLAEDNEVNQRLALALLEERGHTVVVAHNGIEAVRCWAQAPFDCILMDVQMPEMDGMQATATIRARERATQTHVPIIAMTAH